MLIWERRLSHYVVQCVFMKLIYFIIIVILYEVFAKIISSK
ncbi:hypothetical protein ENROMA047B_00010 [Enterobacter rongchengensis]